MRNASVTGGHRDPSLEIESAFGKPRSRGPALASLLRQVPHGWLDHNGQTATMDELLENHWHHLPLAEVRQILDARPDGLGADEVRRRLERFGPNQVSAVSRRGALLRLLSQFNNPLIYILILSAVVTALLKGPVDAIAIVLVVFINAITGFVQESRAEAEIESLRRMVTTEATVVREGERRRVPSAQLVPGDLVALGSGDRVPADL